MRPQFNAQARIARIGREVNRITHQGREELPGIAVVVLVGVVGIDFLHQPTAVVGGVVGHKFSRGVKINDIANEIGHVISVVVRGTLPRPNRFRGTMLDSDTTLFRWRC